MTRARSLGALATVLPLLALASCGGGGGDGAPPPVQPDEVTLTLAADDVGANATQARVRVDLGLPAGTSAALLQADFTADPAVLRPASEPVVAVQSLPTAVGDWQQAGAVRILCGDAVQQSATLLTGGTVAEVVFDLVTPRQPGTTQIQLSGVQIVDGAGNPIAIPAAAASVSVTIL